MRLAPSQIAFPALPRPQCRGLIEARCRLPGSAGTDILFRGLSAAASLKQRQANNTYSVYHVDLFRGLSAAASLKQDSYAKPDAVTWVPALPRPQCRGLIEARLARPRG